MELLKKKKRLYIIMQLEKWMQKVYPRKGKVIDAKPFVDPVDKELHVN